MSSEFPMQVADGPAQPQVIIPKAPNPTEDLEHEAAVAIRFLERFTNSSTLDADLRLGFADVKATLKNLVSTVKQQAGEAQRSHDRAVELSRSQRLIG